MRPATCGNDVIGRKQPPIRAAARARPKISGLTPARKNSAPQTATKRIVCPRSGSATSSAAVMMRSTTASILPGTSGRRLPSAKSQAVITMKAGFMNSEGWIEMPPRKSQRREPLISSPTKSTATISARQTTSRISAVAAHLARREEGQPDHQRSRERRVEGVAEDEVQAVEAEPLRDRRARREGEHEAGDRSSIVTRESIVRSTVHHQSESGER